MQKLKMYPYFDIAHYVLVNLLIIVKEKGLQMCVSVKDDLGPSSTSFSRKHPFSCWLSCMLTSFAGSTKKT